MENKLSNHVRDERRSQESLRDSAIIKGPALANETGVVDRKTLGAVIRWQGEKKLAPTGIVAAELATSLGLSLP